MKVCTCFMLFGIFDYTNSTTRNRTKVYHRSINPAIENVLELSKEKDSGDNKTLDNLHHIIAKETTASDKNKKHALRVARTKTITDFIKEAVNILNTYEDTAFQDFFDLLDTEITKYHYRDCRFSELTQNQDTRSFLAGSLQILRDKSVSFIKANINEVADMMRDETYGNDVKKMLDYINSLYTHTEQKFRRVLNEIRHYRKTTSVKAHKNLIKVIRNGVRDILFDHYTALDSNTRRELKERIEKFWNKFKKHPALSAEANDSHEINATVSKSVISSIEVSKNEINEDPEHYSKNDPQRNLRNKRDRKSKGKEYYQQPQDNKTEKDDSSNEYEKRNTDTETPDEISSEQSFDSSSNSIKQSQERHAKYNTDRYMTLYPEEISYKSRTTKKTEIIPISANEMTKKTTVPRRPTTTSAPTYSAEDESVGSNKDYELRSHYNPDDGQGISYSDHKTENVVTEKSKPGPRRIQGNKQRKLSMPDKSKSNPHKNMHIIGEYNAVIDVQLTNTELLKSLGIFQPVNDNK